MSKTNRSESPELLLPMAIAALDIARAEFQSRDVSPEMDEIAMVLQLTGMYAEDIGSTGPELKLLRIEGLLQAAQAIMTMVSEGGQDAVNVDLAHKQVMNLHAKAAKLVRLPPMLPKPGALSPKAAAKAILKHDLFQGTMLQSERVADEAEGDFEEVTEEDMRAADGPQLEPLCPIVEPLSRRRIAGFFGNADSAKVFGFDLDDSSLNDPTDHLDEAFAAMEGAPAPTHAAT